MYVLKTSLSFIGMPGVGKSKLAARLAANFNLVYLDLDEFIEKTNKRTLSQIWNQEKELGFRIRERLALFQVLSGDPLILSCGGGTACFFDNMRLINDHSFSIYLKTDQANLTEEMLSGKHPVFSQQMKPADKWNELLKIRSVYYKQAQKSFQAFNIEPNVAEAVSCFCLEEGLIIKKK